ARVVFAARAPHLANDLLLRDDQPTAARKALEHPIFDGRQMDVARSAAGRSPFEIELKIAGAKYRRVLRAPRVAPERGAHAREQLRCTKRLGDVVVRASIQRCNLL